MTTDVRGRRRRALRPAALLRGCVAALAAAFAAGLAIGCATYTDRTSSASLSAGAGNYAGAVASLNRLLGVSSADETPSSLSGDKPLLLLDRAVLQQALQQYDGSRRDLSAAEQKLELLDLGTNAVATLGGYLYSDSVKTYRTPPTERLSLNAVNMLNYLASGDLDGAAVEARRFQVMREYLDSIRATSPAPDRLGAYLAGFVFEKRGEGDRALRYYDEALSGSPLPSLGAPVARLARTYPYRGKNLERVIGQGASVRASASAKTAAPAELLVVLGLGRVPHKVPQRIAVGAAVGVAGAFLGDRDLDVLRYSASKVLVYPELVPTPSSLGRPSLRVNGREVGVETLALLGDAVVDEYQRAKPKILAAALARVASRAAIAEGTRAAGRQDSQALGDVLSILVEATMVALDKPDTRSWTMLPDRVLVARVPVAPGTQDVSVSFDGGYGAGRNVRVNVGAGGWGVVVVTEPR